MISHVYLSAVLMLAALPVVWCQCTTSRWQDSKYEPPRWENGAVYLESLLTETSERILGAVESRLADQTATMASRLADQTATMESRLAKESVTIENRLTEAVDARLTTLKADLENSTTGHLEALESRLAQHTEAVDARLATLKTELENTTTKRLAALERRLADKTGTMESRLAGLAATKESRIAAFTGTIESGLAQQAEAVNERLATLQTDLKNVTTDLLEALEERMVVENRNLANNSESRLSLTIGAIINNMEERMVVENRKVTINSESRLNLTIGATMNSMEERIRHEIRTVANTTEIQLQAAQTQTNVTVGAVLHGVEASLTTLCSSRGSDQLIAAVYNMSKAQLQLLRLLTSRVPLTFLRRVDGSVNFTRDWADYKSGFGGVTEYWLGLETLHQLTAHHTYGLRVDMEDYSGERKWASYQSFRVGGESGNYVLTVTGYNPDSTAGDSMAEHNGMEFTTVDRDNDEWGSNCASTNSKGGWWYKSCQKSNPTGVYKPAGYRAQDGIYWRHAYGDSRSFKSMSLKLEGN